MCLLLYVWYCEYVRPYSPTWCVSSADIHADRTNWLNDIKTCSPSLHNQTFNIKYTQTEIGRLETSLCFYNILIDNSFIYLFGIRLSFGILIKYMVKFSLTPCQTDVTGLLSSTSAVGSMFWWGPVLYRTRILLDTSLSSSTVTSAQHIIGISSVAHFWMSRNVRVWGICILKEIIARFFIHF